MSELHLPHLPFSVSQRTREKRQAHSLLTLVSPKKQPLHLRQVSQRAAAKPVYGVYSTFIQRTYDQLSQDLCINNSPATLLVYLASVYGMNDVTHLGIYDIPMMSNIPNLVYLAPTTKEEYLAMLDWSIEQNDHPVAIRVPISVVSDGKKVTKDFSKLNEYEVTQNGSKIAIVALGSFYSVGAKTAELSKTKQV